MLQNNLSTFHRIKDYLFTERSSASLKRKPCQINYGIVTANAICRIEKGRRDLFPLIA